MLAGHYSQDVIAVKSGIYQLFIRITLEGGRQSAVPADCLLLTAYCLPQTACEESRFARVMIYNRAAI
jgi:hypothetical protein